MLFCQTRFTPPSSRRLSGGAIDNGRREASAHVIVGYEGTPEQKRELSERFGFRWCGYTSREVVYARDAE